MLLGVSVLLLAGGCARFAKMGFPVRSDRNECRSDLHVREFDPMEPNTRDFHSAPSWTARVVHHAVSRSRRAGSRVARSVLDVQTKDFPDGVIKAAFAIRPRRFLLRDYLTPA